MPINRLLETRTTSFGELFGNGRRYSVPAFQRDYAWDIENWEDLWQDILISHTSKSPHFMGAIVTQVLENEPATFEHGSAIDDGRNISYGDRFAIIDGQQRLATISILIIAVIHAIESLIDRGVKPEENQARQEILRRTYLGDRDPGSLRYSSKLFLNGNDNGFYQANLVNLRRPKYLTSFTQSEQRLWRAFEYFLQQVESHESLSSSGASLANFLTDTVTQQLLFIQISVEDKSSAYVLFETLNSRGVELGAVDLLKNYIFSLLQGPDDYYGGRQAWQKIVSVVGMKALPNFLQCFLCLSDGNVRQRKLFNAVRQKVTNAEQSFELLTQLGDYSNLYVALRDSQDDVWKQYSKSTQVRKWIRQLNLFELTQFDPVLLAASDKFDDGKFEKLLRMLVILSFRYLVSQLNLNELERQSVTLAVAISKGQVKSPKAAFRSLSSLYVEDDKFQQDFAYLSVVDSRKKRWVKYILQQLEKDISGTEIIEASFSIEHILPQTPDNDWLRSFDSRKTLSMVYRLGNVTPLEPAVNSALGRAAYPQKKAAFADSAFQMTRAIQSNEWTEVEVVERQLRMAEQAVRIWQLNDYRD